MGRSFPTGCGGGDSGSGRLVASPGRVRPGCVRGRGGWVCGRGGLPTRAVTAAVPAIGRPGGAAVDVGDQGGDEVFVAVGEERLGPRLDRRFAGPGGLSGGAVAVEARSAGRDPFAEPVAGLGEV